MPSKERLGKEVFSSKDPSLLISCKYPIRDDLSPTKIKLVSLSLSPFAQFYHFLASLNPKVEKLPRQKKYGDKKRERKIRGQKERDVLDGLICISFFMLHQAITQGRQFFLLSIGSNRI